MLRSIAPSDLESFETSYVEPLVVDEFDEVSSRGLSSNLDVMRWEPVTREMVVRCGDDKLKVGVSGEVDRRLDSQIQRRADVGEGDGDSLRVTWQQPEATSEKNLRDVFVKNGVRNVAIQFVKVPAKRPDFDGVESQHVRAHEDDNLPLDLTSTECRSDRVPTLEPM